MIDCTPDEVLCWLAAGALAFGLLFSSQECQPYTDGTDMYHECVSGEPLDLSPTEGN